jgi:hypothetical protein
MWFRKISLFSILLLFISSPSIASQFRENETIRFSVDRNKIGADPIEFIIDLSGYPAYVESWCEGDDLDSMPFCGGISVDAAKSGLKKKIEFRDGSLALAKIIESFEGQLIRSHTVKYTPAKKYKALVVTEDDTGTSSKQRVIADKEIDLVSIESLILSQLFGDDSFGPNLHWFEPKRSKRMAVELNKGTTSLTNHFPTISAKKMSVLQVDTNRNQKIPMFSIYFNDDGLPVEVSAKSRKWLLGAESIGVMKSRQIDLERVIAKALKNPKAKKQVVNAVSFSGGDSKAMAKLKKKLTTVDERYTVRESLGKLEVTQKQTFSSSNKLSKNQIEDYFENQIERLSKRSKIDDDAFSFKKLNKNNYALSLEKKAVCSVLSDKIKSLNKKSKKNTVVFLDDKCSDDIVIIKKISIKLGKNKVKSKDGDDIPKEFKCKKGEDSGFIFTSKNVKGAEFCTYMAAKFKRQSSRDKLAFEGDMTYKYSPKYAFSDSKVSAEIVHTVGTAGLLKRYSDLIFAHKVVPNLSFNELNRLKTNNASKSKKSSKGKKSPKAFSVKYPRDKLSNVINSDLNKLIRSAGLKQSGPGKWVGAQRGVIGQPLDLLRELSRSELAGCIIPENDNLHSLVFDIECQDASYTKAKLWQ